MKSLDFSRYALCSCVAAAMLAGCGGSQAPIGAPGAMPQSRAIATHALRGGSWMLPEAKSVELLYVAVFGGKLYVFSYPRLKMVGELNLGYVNVQGICSDASGDIFVPAWTGGTTVNGSVYEYAHGGTQPIVTLDDPLAGPTSCAVDPTTGDLAVTNYFGSGGPYYSNVAIYEPGSANPTIFTPALKPQWAAYDDDGDLFVDGLIKGDPANLAVLPKGSNNFSSVTLSQSIKTFSLQWYRDQLTIVSSNRYSDNDENIYAVNISGTSGTIVGMTTLKAHHFRADTQVWIQGDRVVGAGRRGGTLDVWRFPSGGDALEIVKKQISPSGVTVSVAPSR